jgi:hypothetical protein
MGGARGTWKQTGGGALPVGAALVAGAVFAYIFAPPVAGAVNALLRTVLLAGLVAFVVVVAALSALLVHHLRSASRPPKPPPWRADAVASQRTARLGSPSQQVTGGRAALPAPVKRELHLHIHGDVDPARAAAEARAWLDGEE